MKFLRIFPLLFLLSCEKEYVYNGTFVKDDSVKQLVLSKSSRDDVVSLIGLPTITLTDDEWLYVSQKVEQKSFLKPKIHQTTVFKVSFKDDKLCAIKKITPKNNDIIPDSTVTTINEEKLTFLEQLYKNVYKIGKK